LVLPLFSYKHQEGYLCMRFIASLNIVIYIQKGIDFFFNLSS